MGAVFREGDPGVVDAGDLDVRGDLADACLHCLAVAVFAGLLVGADDVLDPGVGVLREVDVVPEGAEGGGGARTRGTKSSASSGTCPRWTFGVA